MNIAIVSTDNIYATMLRLELERCGFSALVITDASEAGAASMLVLDADSTDKSAVQGITDAAGAAIIFSREEDLLDTLSGMHSGANFRYLRRPFAIDTFLSAAHELSGLLKKDDRVTLDRQLHTVQLRGESVTLTEQEFRLFSLLYERRGAPVSREEALSYLRRERQTGGNIVDVYIKYIRTKLERAFGDPMIKTVRGKGYMLP